MVSKEYIHGACGTGLVLYDEIHKKKGLKAISRFKISL